MDLHVIHFYKWEEFTQICLVCLMGTRFMGDHVVSYIDVESPYCTTESNITLYGNSNYFLKSPVSDIWLEYTEVFIEF